MRDPTEQQELNLAAEAKLSRVSGCRLEILLSDDPCVHRQSRNPRAMKRFTLTPPRRD